MAIALLASLFISSVYDSSAAFDGGYGSYILLARGWTSCKESLYKREMFLRKSVLSNAKKKIRLLNYFVCAIFFTTFA